jgi:coenzyme F420-0:L-glutamate ligase / coenzyme F420-1:gamma-L-glutamate ligase
MTAFTPDFVNFLRNRRSIRKFTDQPVPDNLLRRILETGCTAPSAHNSQPWRFVAFTSPAARAELAERLTSEMARVKLAAGEDAALVQLRTQRTLRRFTDAPAVVLVCLALETAMTDQSSECKGELLLAQHSVAAVITYLLLAAHAEGLGACWVGYPAFCSAACFNGLGVDAGWKPQAAVLFGYAAELPAPPERIPLDQILRPSTMDAA